MIDSKKVTNLGQLDLFPKIYKGLSEVRLGRSVISNCRNPPEKVSEILDSEIKSAMQEGC